MLDSPARATCERSAAPAGPAKAARADASGSADRLPRVGIAARVLVVTIGFALLAMGLFYLARLAAYRDYWLHTKVTTAQTAFDAFDLGGPGAVPPDLAGKVLRSVGVRAIEVSTPSGRKTISVGPLSPTPPVRVDLGTETFVDGVAGAVGSLLAGRDAVVAVTDASGRIEVTLDEARLVEGLWRVSTTFFHIALLIATVVAGVLWTALWLMVLRPMRRLTSNIIAFGERPQDVSRIMTPSGRGDEVGRAELALAAMQTSLAHELAQRKRLAELGMAVARINHDLRNILTAAQLISDRLAAIPDPLAQRLAPRLVATLDRAIQFCQATLTYGAAREQAPNRNAFDLSELVRQVVDSARAENGETIDYHIEIPPMFDVYADRDHVLRVLENLSRNATQALIARGAQGERPKAIRFAAIRAEGFALIEISDTGPGFPPDQSERIFEPFHMSTSEAGTGLGLAIAADLVARNGGAIALAPSKPEDFYCGARFLIKLPTLERGSRSISRLSLDA